MVNSKCEEDDTMDTICLQCGDRGFTNAFVYCVKCLGFAVHRYCMDVMTHDEFVYWVCDHCNSKGHKQSTTLKRDVIPCQKTDRLVSKNGTVAFDQSHDARYKHISAQPIITSLWRGSFNILNKEEDIALKGILAHISSKACPKVYQTTIQFQPMLHLEILPKSDVWPKKFEISEPTVENIALYFFPSGISVQSFDQLVDDLMQKELAMRGIVQNAELLIFSSNVLPTMHWRFNAKYYLWGVFRGKQRKMDLEGNPAVHSDVSNGTVSGEDKNKAF